MSGVAIRIAVTQTAKIGETLLFAKKEIKNVPTCSGSRHAGHNPRNMGRSGGLELFLPPGYH